RRRTAMEHPTVDADPGRRDLRQMLDHQPLDLVEVLVRHQARAELGHGPGRDDRLGALAGVPAPDAGEVECGPHGDPLCDGVALLAGPQLRHSCQLAELVLVEGNSVGRGAICIGQWSYLAV